MPVKKHPRRSTRVKRHYANPKERDQARRKAAAAKIRRNRKRGKLHGKPRSAVISPLTADLMGQMVILRILENIGIRGRDILELIAKAIINTPTPKAEPQESGPTVSTAKKRARSNKKGKTA